MNNIIDRVFNLILILIINSFLNTSIPCRTGLGQDDREIRERREYAI